MKDKQHGYTLIEILIVLFIISIVSSVALLSINRNENRQLEAFANELAEMLTLAEEQAMLQPTVLGLIVDDQSLHFATYQAANKLKENNKWIPLQDKILGMQSIPNEVKVSVELQGNTTEIKKAEGVETPQIIISTNGDLTPFTIYVGKKGKKPRYVIRGDADGHVSNTLLS